MLWPYQGELFWIWFVYLGSLRATGKKEKVYALVELLQFTEYCVPQDICVDYSPATIFEQLVRAVFIQGLTMEGASLHSLYCRSPVHQSALPSWLSTPRIPMHFSWLMSLHFSGAIYRAAGDSLPDVRSVPHDDSVLNFKATRIGRVERLASAWSQARTFKERIEYGQKSSRL